MKVYYHEISKEEVDSINGNMSVGDFMEKYSQPEWCNYPGALLPNLGCWSLLSNRGSISENFCSSCECFNKK